MTKGTIRHVGGASRRPLQFILSLIFLSCVSLHADTGFLDQQAQLAWQDRDKPGKTEEAINLWEQAIKAEPGRAELWIALSKAQGRAVRHAKSSEERQKWADQARDAAQKATEKNPASAEAFAAYGEALGQWANIHKGVHGLSAVHQAVDSLEKSLALNPKYAYAHMLLAEFYRQSPRLISIGDKQKALTHARLAAEYGPTYAINHLVLARACLDLGKKEEGIAELQKILALTSPSDAIPETRADQESAVSMLNALGVVPANKTNVQATQNTPQCGEAAGVCTEQKP